MKRNTYNYFQRFTNTGDLTDEERVLEWLSYQLENDEIEEVTDEMLDKLIEQKKFLAVLFCKSLPNWSLFICSIKVCDGEYIFWLQVTKTRKRARRFWSSWRTSTTSAMTWASVLL